MTSSSSLIDNQYLDSNGALLIAGVTVSVIKDSEQLASLVAQWCQKDWLALDTEFVRRDTYRAIPALIQFYDGEQVWLLDPQQDIDLTLLAQVFESDCIQVLHSAAEDLGVLYQCSGVWINRLQDTQIGMALLNLGQSVGYQKMIEALLAIELDKDETQSDWLARPLSKQQVQYAAEDVIHLAEAWQIQSQKMQQKDNELPLPNQLQRQSCWLDDGSKLVNRAKALHQMEEELAFERVKGAKRLHPKSLIIVKKLAGWREALAQKSNVPKGRILNDKSIVEIAMRQKSDRAFLAQAGVGSSLMKQFGDELIEVIEQAKAVPDQELPERYVLLPKDASGWLKRCHQQVERKAFKLDMDTTLLCRKKDLQDMVTTAWLSRKNEWPIEVDGWRQQILQDDISEIVDQLIADRS
jgi:ribonuclease D